MVLASAPVKTLILAILMLRSKKTETIELVSSIVRKVTATIICICGTLLTRWAYSLTS